MKYSQIEEKQIIKNLKKNIEGLKIDIETYKTAKNGIEEDKRAWIEESANSKNPQEFKALLSEETAVNAMLQKAETALANFERQLRIMCPEQAQEKEM